MGEINVKRFFIDGAGARPDGTGSGFAWVRPGNGTQRVEWRDHLTNNAAEFSALVAVLKYVKPGSHLEISTDSALLVGQFRDHWNVNDSRLAELLSAARDLIDDKELKVELMWIPREQNLAGKLLERKWQRAQAG